MSNSWFTRILAGIIALVCYYYHGRYGKYRRTTSLTGTVCLVALVSKRNPFVATVIFTSLLSLIVMTSLSTSRSPIQRDCPPAKWKFGRYAPQTFPDGALEEILVVWSYWSELYRQFLLGWPQSIRSALHRARCSIAPVGVLGCVL
jgi:hypothetical protein